MILPSAFGASDSLNVSGYPEHVDPMYLDVWVKYITTQTAHDLYTFANSPLGMSYAVCGFISSLREQSRTCFIRKSPSPYELSLRDFVFDVRSLKKELNGWLNSISFTQYFRKAEILVSLDTAYNRVANVQMVTVNFYLVYIPKHENGKIPKIGSVLNRFAPSWFKGDMPKEIFNRTPAAETYRKSPVPNVPDVYPPVRTIMGAKQGWYNWNEKLGVSCARVRGNAFALHVRLERLPIFICHTSKAVLGRTLTNLAKSNIKR